MSAALTIESDPAANQPLQIVVTDAGADAHHLRRLLREAIPVISNPASVTLGHRSDLATRIRRALECEDDQSSEVAACE